MVRLGGALKTPPPYSELLLTAAEGAGAAQARVLPEPRALGPVSLLPTEQVRGVPGRADPTLGAPFVPTRCELCGQKPGLGQDCPKTPIPGPQVPYLLPKDHCSQDVRSRRPCLHLPQLHHHCPGEARHRPRQHREALSLLGRGGEGSTATTGPSHCPVSCRSAFSSASPTTSSQRSLWRR